MRSWLPLLFLATRIAAGQHSSATVTNPYTSPEDRAAGAESFRSLCAGCHGLDGKGGGAGPDLTTGSFRHGSSDQALFQVIVRGVSGTAMPGFSMNGREVWQIVAHIRLLNAANVAEKPKGDAGRGARLYHTNDCARCHAIAGQGGLLGPELTGITALRTLRELERSILEPNETVAADYWAVRGRMKNGRALAGIRLNEDTHSLQIRESGGRLVSLDKRDVTAYKIVKSSPMPSFRGKLAGSDLDDLLTYLASLRGEQNGGVR